MTELLEIRFSGVVIEDAADMYEIAARRVCSSKIQPSQLIFTSELGPRQSAIAIQNSILSLSAVIGLICSLPLMLAVAIAVKAGFEGADPVQPAPGRDEWPRLHALQISIHVYGCRVDEQEQSGLAKTIPASRRSDG